MSVARDNILPPEEAPDASSKLFREYAAEFVELARNATSADQRFLYLKMANIWQETAIRWERDLVKAQEKVLMSLIPALSCRSCRPNAPFAELVRLSRTSIADEMREEYRRRVLGD